MDWQSQCAMNVTAEDGMYARELRFLPTQGCEADASTVESEEIRTVPLARVTPASNASGLAPGSFSSDTGDFPRSNDDAEPVTVEHCLGIDTVKKDGDGFGVVVRAWKVSGVG